MTNELTQLEMKLLLGAAADLERLRRGKLIPGVAECWHSIQDAKADAQDGLVRLATARWLDEESLEPRARMAVTRALVRLERRGLAERAAAHWAEERANYLRLTDAGRKLARQLKAEAANS